jgi:hypothetical protein
VTDPCCSLRGEEVDVWDCCSNRVVYKSIGSAMAKRLLEPGWLLFPAGRLTESEIRNLLKLEQTS